MEECRGCVVYSKTDNRCAVDIIPHISETEHCPCMSCIVKVMCKGMCQKYKTYSERSEIRATEIRREENIKKYGRV